MNYKIKIVTLHFIMFSFFLSVNGQSPVKVSNTEERNSLLKSAFPELKAKTLAGKEISFPGDMKDKPTIICVAFKDETQKIADSWTKEIMTQYNDSQIHYFEVPMLKSGLKMMQKMIDGGMRKGIDKDLHDNVATYYGDLAGYKKKIQMPDEMTCYIFLADKSGNIQFTSEGEANKEKLQQLYKKIEEINSEK
jgi:ATP10 protein